MTSRFASSKSASRVRADDQRKEIPRHDPIAAPHLIVARLIAAAGAVLLACAVALAAYAAHGVDAAAQSGLYIASAFAFGHGLALAALAPRLRSRLAIMVLITMLSGTLLFCGGLIASALFGINAGVAPIGGSLLILAWLSWAWVALRG